ncbi:MAG TPA: PAS domain-containing protein [Caulobacteraceae bacterium]
MRVYTFFYCKPDGSAPSFEAYKFASDDDAVQRSHALLEEHESCSHVLVCDGDREVAATPRPGLEPPAAPLAPQRRQELPAGLRDILTSDEVEAAGAALIATAHDGTVVYWNAAATRLYGWDAEEALGRNVVELTPALQSREEALDIMRRLQRGESWEGEIILRRRDGTPFKAFVADVPVVAEGVIVGASEVASRREAVGRVMPLLRAARGVTEPAPR